MKCGKEIRHEMNERGFFTHSDDYHIDHIIPISKGGSEWDLDNLELSCPTCNLKKGAKMNYEPPVKTKDMFDPAEVEREEL